MFTFRYEIATGSTDWTEAERQIRKATKDGLGKSLTVSVKTGKDKKRKAGEAVEEAYKEAEQFREAGAKKKKSKFGKGSK
jgi:N-acetyltransferase 10